MWIILIRNWGREDNRTQEKGQDRASSSPGDRVHSSPEEDLALQEERKTSWFFESRTRGKNVDKLRGYREGRLKVFPPMASGIHGK